MPILDETTTRTTTRLSLQAVAEHVLSAALHRANGHIGLRRTPGGFGTPELDQAGEWRQLSVAGTDLVVRDGAGTRRAPITTLRAAGELVGIGPGAPRDVYTPATPLDLDAPLAVDADAGRRAGRLVRTGGRGARDPPRRGERSGAVDHAALARALRPGHDHRRGELRRFAGRRGARPPVPLRRTLEPACDRRLLERVVRGQPVRRVRSARSPTPWSFFREGRRRLG